MKLYLREVEVIQEVHELAVARRSKVCASFLLQGQSHRVLSRREETDAKRRRVCVNERLYSNPWNPLLTCGADHSR